MPTVPRYDEPQVQERGMPGFRDQAAAPIEAFGGGASNAAVFEAARGIAGKAQDIHLQEMVRANQLANQGHDAELMKAESRIQSDVENMLGKNAAGAPEYINAEWKKTVDEVRKQAANDEQKAAIDRIASIRLQNLNKVSQSHMSKQFRVHDDQQTVSYLALARDQALQNYQDPDRVSLAIYQQEMELEKFAERHGLSPEDLAFKKSQAVSQTHAGVLERMLDSGQDLAAQKYYAEHKEFFTGEDAGKVEKVLEEGTLRGASQREADAIVAKHGSLTSALTAAKAIEDPKLRDAVTERVRNDFTLKDAAKRDGLERLHLQAVNRIEQGGSWDDIPASQKAVMPQEMRESLQRYAQKKAEGTHIPAAGAEYYNLKLKAAEPKTRPEFLQMDLNFYRGKVRDNELKELIDIQTDAKKGGKDGEAALDGFMTDFQVADGVMKEIGIKPDSKKGAAFRRRLDQAAAVQMQSTGKKLSNDELRTIADSLAVNVVTDKGLWNTEKRLLDLEDGEEIEAVEFDEIPAKERKRFEDFLKSKGAKPTPEAVEALYAQYLRNLHGR